MKKKCKGLLFLLISVFVLQTIPVGATEIEWYDLKEENILLEDIQDNNEGISPNTLYIAGATITLQKMGTGKFGMRSEVFCSETMKKIETTFKLQKKSGSSWKTVGTGTVSQNDSNKMYKSMTASGVSSGTYRCVASSKVTSYSGYSETVSITSGSVEM